MTPDERHEIQRLGIVERCSIAEIARRTDRVTAAPSPPCCSRARARRSSSSSRPTRVGKCCGYCE
ncbi:MAG: helix-turn-helix domain-containing protein [Alphaproteobacteria bacterium]|nr:helix-turn-helix domain-containing protein [Alphaproteobacteria bacterium]